MNLSIEKVEDPVVHGDTEWISVLFHGQSFMLHQIVSITHLPVPASTITHSSIAEKNDGRFGSNMQNW